MNSPPVFCILGRTKVPRKRLQAAITQVGYRIMSRQAKAVTHVVTSQTYFDTHPSLRAQVENQTVHVVIESDLEVVLAELQTEPGQEADAEHAEAMLLEESDPSVSRQRRTVATDQLPTALMKFKCMRARKWNMCDDLTGWWLSEARDGVRAVWDGRGSMVVANTGQRIEMPERFLRGLPDVGLDGVFVIGKDAMGEEALEETKEVVCRGGSEDARWDNVSFVVFDAPGMKESFEVRCKFLLSVVADCEAPSISLLRHVQVTSREDLFRRVDDVWAAQGVGAMLRRPRSAYTFGPSDDLLSVKPVRTAAAIVVDHPILASGKPSTSVNCQLDNHQRQDVSASLIFPKPCQDKDDQNDKNDKDDQGNALRRNHPKATILLAPGTKVTLQFMETTTKTHLPKHAMIVLEDNFAAGPSKEQDEPESSIE